LAGPGSPVSPRSAAWALAWLACTVATLSLFAHPTTARIDPDEAYWIGSSYYYHLAFEQGDWRGTHPDWKLLPARENPPVAKYVIGLGLALSGRHITTIDGLGTFYAFFAAKIGQAEREKEQAAKQAAVLDRMNPELRRLVTDTRKMYLDPGLIVAARVIMLACAALTSLFVFIVGASTAGSATGLLASQILLIHPAVRNAYDHAMADAVALMFGAAAALAAWLFFRRFYCHPERSEGSAVTPRTGVLFALLNGVLIGLAAAAKMNWLTVAFLFGAAVLYVAVESWRRDRTRSWLAIACGAGGLATALAVFVLINPAIVGDPIAGLVAVVREPQMTTAVQARVLAYPAYLASVGAKLSAVGRLMLGSPLLFALAALGVAIATVRAPRVGVWFVAAWWAIALVVVTAWIPFEWKRYILPMVIPFTVLVAYTLVAGTSALIRIFKQSPPHARVPA